MAESLQIDTLLVKSGKWVRLSANSAITQANGNWIQGSVTSVPGVPSFKVNGNPVAIDLPGRWLTTTNYVAYLLKCGSVQTINFSNMGSGYTAPTIAWNGDGGGSGIVLGTPVLARGITSYTITSPGSGYTTTCVIPIPAIAGQSPSQPAWALVRVVGGIVVSVTPVSGSPIAYGIGYTGTTATGISLPGSAAWGYGPDSTSSFFWKSIPQSGSGLVVTGTIGKYIEFVPVVNGGSAFTAPPTFTVTDSTGTGAILVPVMSGPLATDVVTYSAPSGWMVATVGTTTGVLAPAASNAPVFNSKGVLEAPIGHTQGFTAPVTLQAGGNLGLTPTSHFRNGYFSGKNKLKCADPWQPGFGANSFAMTLDANHYMASWTPNSWVVSNFYGLQDQQNPTLATVGAPGNWAVQYDDDFYGGDLNGANAPACVSMSAVGSFGATISIVPGPFVTTPAGTATVAGGIVTGLSISNVGAGLQAVLVTLSGGGGSNAAAVGTVVGGVLQSLTLMCPGSGYTSAPTVTITPVAMVGGAVTLIYNAAYSSLNNGGNMVLSLAMVSGADGLCHAHNPWAIAPGNTIDRSKPLATDDVVVANLTRNGLGPGVIRPMQSLGEPFVPQVIDPSDLPSPNDYSWILYHSWLNIVPPVAPNQPFFSGTTTAGSTSVTGIADTSTLVVGQPIVGNGIPGILFDAVNSRGTQAHISAIVDAHTITLSIAAKSTGVQSLSINPYSSGTVTFNFGRRYSTDPSNPHGLPWGSSPRVYSSQNFAITGTDSFGPYLDITNGPRGGADNGNLLTFGIQSITNGILELRSNLPHGMKTGQATVYGQQVAFLPDHAFSGNSLAGTNTILNATSASLLFPGQIITGPGVPSSPYTVITDVTGATVTVSATITATGTGVAFNYTAALNFNAAGNFPIASNHLNTGYPNGPIWVTGPNTIAVWIGGLTGTGSGNDFVAATTETPTFLPMQVVASTMSFPYQYAAAFAANWPNTALHLNLSWGTSDPCLQAIATSLAPILGPSNMVLIEMGNEHWNVPLDNQESLYEQQLAYALRYVPSGTNTYQHFTPTRATSFYVTIGVNTLVVGDAMNCLMAANKHYVFATAFALAGGNPNNVKLIYGSGYSQSNVTGNIVTAVNTMNLPQDYICIAPYYGMGGDSPYYNACLPLGYVGPGGGAAGNWPVDAQNDMVRHYHFFSTALQSMFSTHYNLMSGTNMRLMGYEGGPTYTTTGPPFADQLQQDMYAHSSFADVSYCWYAACQNGDPKVANSGMTYASMFSLYSNAAIGPLWKFSDGADQIAGPGLTNQFVTQQGGTPGTGNKWGYYQTNQSTGIFGMATFYGGAAVPDTTATHRRSGLATPRLAH